VFAQSGKDHLNSPEKDEDFLRFAAGASQAVSISSVKMSFMSGRLRSAYSIGLFMLLV
jgi:hypothetical protein